MLEAVQIRDPERVYDLYPHEVSGGMGQRVMIAMMLVAGARADHRRRADLGARRDGAAAGAGHPRRAGARPRHRPDHDQPRPEPRAQLLRPRADHVRRSGGRGTRRPRTSTAPSTPIPAACWRRSRSIGGGRAPLPVLRAPTRMAGGDSLEVSVSVETRSMFSTSPSASAQPPSRILDECQLLGQPRRVLRPRRRKRLGQVHHAALHRAADRHLDRRHSTSTASRYARCR